MSSNNLPFSLKTAMDDEDLFSLLDAEVLDQIVSRLAPEDVARLGCASSRLQAHISSGRLALHLWIRHCRDLLGELAVAYVAASCKADQARTWLELYASAHVLDRLHWSPAAPAAGDLALISHSPSAQQRHQQQQQQQLVVPAPDAAALLARTGHTATAVGSLLVVLGGDMRDGPAPAVSDVLVVDLPSSHLVQPRLHGKQPQSLREHCTVLLNPQAGSALLEQVSAAVSEALSDSPTQNNSAAAAPSSQLVPQGHTLAVFGGLLPDGAEQAPGDQLHVLWLSPDAKWGVWVHPSTTGPAPAPRAYSCSAGIHGGTQLLVYGGWVNGSITGTAQADVGEVDGYALLCVYVLDTATLSWSRVPTRPLNEPPRPGHVMLGPSTCPGPRKKALSCLRVNPLTGQQEFMLLGGCGVDGLADFVPYSLNLQTFYWTKGPVMGYLPPARTHCSVMRLTPTWLVMVGGQGPSKQRLQDVQRLHLPTLSWRPPVHVADTTHSNSSVDHKHSISSCSKGGLQEAGVGQQGLLVEGRTFGCSTATAGSSADAGVLVGGLHHGAYGSCIVPCLQVLLPGPPIPPAANLQHRAAAGRGPLAAGMASFTSLPQGFAHMQLLQQPDPQQPAAWHAFATGSCRCGSCCGCLAVKAAASGVPGLPSCLAGLELEPAATQPPELWQVDGDQQQQQQPDYGGSAHTAGGQQRSPGATGSVQRWQSVGGCSPQQKPRNKDELQDCQGCGTNCIPALQGPVGWSGEFEIEPAPPVPPQLPGALGFRGQRGQAQARGSEGAERVWQMGSSSSSRDGWLLQVVLACFVVLVGLVLMAPSLMMHQEG